MERQSLVGLPLHLYFGGGARSSFHPVQSSSPGFESRRGRLSCANPCRFSMAGGPFCNARWGAGVAEAVTNRKSRTYESGRVRMAALFSAVTAGLASPISASAFAGRSFASPVQRGLKRKGRSRLPVTEARPCVGSADDLHFSRVTPHARPAFAGGNVFVPTASVTSARPLASF